MDTEPRTPSTPAAAPEAGPPLLQPPQHSWLERIGRSAVATVLQGRAFVDFVGEAALAALRVLPRPRLWRARDLARDPDRRL